jgi:hypothetical protein
VSGQGDTLTAWNQIHLVLQQEPYLIRQNIPHPAPPNHRDIHFDILCPNFFPNIRSLHRGQARGSAMTSFVRFGERKSDSEQEEPDKLPLDELSPNNDSLDIYQNAQQKGNSRAEE